MEAIEDAGKARRLPKVTPRMISDIDYLGREWGRRMRYEPNGWYPKNHLANHLEDYLIGSNNSYKVTAISSDNLDQYDRGSSTSGTMSRSAAAFNSLGTLGSNPQSGSKQRIKFKPPEPPVGFMNEDQQLFHRAFRRLKECEQAMLWFHFASTSYASRQLTLPSITQCTYDLWLNQAIQAVTRKITAIELETPIRCIEEKAKAPTFIPLWPCKPLSYVHKVAINDSHRNPYPISLDKQGHKQPSGLYTELPFDQTIYCLRENGNVYAEISYTDWTRLRRRKKLDSTLTAMRSGDGPSIVSTEPPIRLLHQTHDGIWWFGQAGSRIKVGKDKGLDDFALTWRHPYQDCLRAIEGFDNQAYIATHGSDFAFTKSIKFPESDAMRDIQSPAVHEQIEQKLCQYKDDIRQARTKGLDEVAKQKTEDMQDFMRLTKGSYIKPKSKPKARPRRIDDDDPWRKIVCKLRVRKIRARQRLKKLGLDEEAEDIDRCYKTKGRSAVYSPANSIFIWKCSFE